MHPFNDPLFPRVSAAELDGITQAPEAAPGACSIAPLVIGAIVAGAAAAASGGSALALNKKYTPREYDINKKSFQDERSLVRDQEIQILQDNARDREAPQAEAARRWELAQSQGATLGPTERAQGAQLGPAAQGNAATIGRQDEQFRQGQANLAATLQAQANGQGPSLAGAQLREATNRNIRQQMAVAAAQGGNPAAAQRSAALNAIAANRQAGIDAATMRVQEQLAARQQLAGVLDSGRAQDIGVNTSQAQLAQQMGLANMDASNNFALTQAQLAQANAQFNAGQGNTMSLEQARLLQQNQQFNAGAANEMYGQNFQAAQQTAMQNLAAKLQMQGLNDEQTRAYLQMKLASREADRQAAIDYERLKTQQNVGLQGIEAGSADAQTDRTMKILGGFMGGAGSAAGSMAAASDANAKVNVQALGSGAKDEAARKAADEEERKRLYEAIASSSKKGEAEMSAPSSRSRAQAPPIDVGGGRPNAFAQQLAAFSDPRAKREVSDLTRALARRPR